MDCYIWQNSIITITSRYIELGIFHVYSELSQNLNQSAFTFRPLIQLSTRDALNYIVWLSYGSRKEKNT